MPYVSRDLKGVVNGIFAMPQPETAEEFLSETSDDYRRFMAADLHAAVRAEAARRMAVLAAPYSEEERATWQKQIEEARAIIADTKAHTPGIARLAAVDGVTVVEFAARILEKERALADAAFAILAAQRALLAMDLIPSDFADDSRWTA